MTMFTSVSTPYTVGRVPAMQGAYDSFAITPSDSTDLPLSDQGRHIRFIKATGAGNISVNLTTGGTAVLTSVTAGQVVLCSCSRVLSTSTTATGLIGLY